jgi:hypothetical protein
MQKANQIKCPNCGTNIDVQDVISHQLEEDYKQKFNARLATEQKKYNEEKQKLELEREDFAKKKKQENALFQEKLENRLKEESKAIEQKLKSKILEEQSDRLKSLQDELNEKSGKLKEFNKAMAEVERLKREKIEYKESLQAETEKTINEKLAQEKLKISSDLTQKFENEHKEQFKELQAELNQKSIQLKDLNRARAEVERLKREKVEIRESLEAEIEKTITDKINQEKIKISGELIQKFEKEREEQFKDLQTELNQKSEQLKDLNRARAEVERLKREKDEIKESVEAESQKKLNQTIHEEKEKIAKLEADKTELKFKELQKQLEDQKKLTEEMKRKQEQGSMQLQGEVQELAIEEWLAAHFPLDSITEIKKGARGGDCIQVVNTRTQQNCGNIYYESKRTKDFQPSWIEKFKADIREKGANIGVLVTEVMPSDMDRMGMKDGIWICNFDEFKGLSAVLRESIVQISNALVAQENKGDKMSMLYDYLTGNNFRMQIEAIVEGFTQMHSDLDGEKRSMQRIWKQREKQIEKVTTNTIDMYASIKGIAGNAVQSVKALELPGEGEQGQLEL